MKLPFLATAVALLLASSSSSALAGTPAERMEMCQRDAKNMLKNMEREPLRYSSSLHQLDLNCISGTDAAPIRKLAAYPEITRAYERGSAMYAAATKVKETAEAIEHAGMDASLAASYERQDPPEWSKVSGYADSCQRSLDAAFAADPKNASKNISSGNGAAAKPARQVREECGQIGTLAKAKLEEAKHAAAARDAARLKSFRETVESVKKQEHEGRTHESSKATYAAIRANDAYRFASNELANIGNDVDELARQGADADAAALKNDRDALATKLQADLARVGPLADRSWDKWETAFKTQVSAARRKVISKEGSLPTWWTGSDLGDPQKRLSAALTASRWGYRVSGCEIIYTFGKGTVSSAMSPSMCR